MFIKDYYGMIYKNPPKQKETQKLSNISFQFMFYMLILSLTLNLF